MKRCTRPFLLLALLVGFGHAPALWAAACSNVATGNWNAAGTWAAPCNVAGGPTAADTVTIIDNTTVTVNAAGLAANSVTIAMDNRDTTLTFAAGSSLAVTNNVVVDPPIANNRTKQINVATATLTVGGDVTLNGGTVASRDALLTVSSGLITIEGGLIINSTVATSSTASITAAGGRITVNGAAGVTNGDVVSVGAGTFSVTNAAATFTNSSGTNLATTTVSTGTLDITGNLTNAAGETMTVSSTGDITVAGTLTNNGTITLSTTGTVNANGDFTGNVGSTFTNTAAGNLNIGGNATMGGTFNGGIGTVTFNGGTAQTLGGTVATTFNNLTINKSSGNVTIISTSAALSPTVNGILNLTSGNLVTTVGTNDIGLGTAGTVSGGSATSYVQGAVQKNYAAAGTLTFPVGDATNYTPVVIAGTAGFTAGSLTISTTGGGDHPSIASSGIDPNKSVNRYWTLTAAGVPASTYTATFNYVNGSPVDFDSGATPANFIVEQWNGTNWFPTTLAGSCTPTPAANLCTQITGETGFGDFAIGEPLLGMTPVPGLYNAFETSTPAGSILGVIQTKVAGIGFSVDIVHINAAKKGVLAGGITVEVRVLDSGGGGALDVNGCNAAWPLIQALPNFAIPASGRGTIPAATVANSYPSVRFQIRSPVAGPYTQIGCSTDLFAIRPQSLTITAHDATWATAGTGRTLANIGASGGNVHRASTSATPLPFTLRATPVPAGATNYNGTPTTVAGFPTCTGLGALCTNPGALSYTAGSWSAAGSGVRENATATYSEAGAFNLQLEDAVYANVDVVDGTPVATRTVPATASAQIGRFVPDHFDVTTLAAPTFRTFNAADAACSAGTAPRRTFTYIGQPFGTLTTPQATIIARNAAGATTANYAGTLWKIGGATPGAAKDCTTDPNICQFTTSWAAGGNSSNVIENYTYVLIPVSTPNWDDAGATPVAATVTAGTGVNAGTGIITYASSDALAFKRNTAAPQATFTANITNTISVQDTSEFAVVGNGTITTTTAAAFGGIAFDSGNEFRYGRLQFLNAHGSGLLALDIPIQVEYWNGTLWLRNAADNCTSVGPANFALGNVTTVPPIPALSTNAGGGGTVSGGGGSITLTKPTGGTNGFVDVTINLGATGTPNATPCPAWAPAPAATALNAPYLQSQCAGAGTYTRDPSARATFGIFRNKFILLRENY